MPYPNDAGAKARGISLVAERRKNKSGMSAQCLRAQVAGAVQ
jgi:hypothetical protein